MGAFGNVGTVLRSVKVLHGAGLVPLGRPGQVLASARAVRRLGPIAGAAAAAAARDRRAVGVVDESGALTFHELDLRSNALARAWQDLGFDEHSVVALLTRDHRGAVDTMLATGKLGSRLVLMNTGFAGPQLADVAVREGVTAVVFDEEFGEVVAQLPQEVARFVAWHDADVAFPTLEGLISSAPHDPVDPPASPGRMVLLTSGTTGTPKGAPRQVRSPLAAAQFLDRIPLRSSECTVIAAPLFHATGLSQLVIAFALGSTVVLRRRFDPLTTVRDLATHRATGLVVIPTMLQRMVDLPPEELEAYDTSSLRVIFVAGSALSSDLARRASERFGDVIYNLYGSTEVSVITVATPDDWRRAPGTVGRPPIGCRLALVDEDGREITAPHVVGRVFAGSGLSFAGYTDGQHKEMHRGLLSSGDLGHLDEEGRLFIDGRDDDMIVSGGENVFPGEVEDLLVSHPDVVEAAVLGVDDAEFGQVLHAFVVLRPGSEPDEDLLRTYVRGHLARFKVPRRIYFLDELPRNATGKLLRRRLSPAGE